LTDQSGFYTRMLPPKERPIEALGGVLNGLGVAGGVLALFLWPVLLGTAGVVLAGISLPMARTPETARRFAIGFAIAAAGWTLGLILAIVREKSLGAW
jgi:hypothetical protein